MNDLQSSHGLELEGVLDPEVVTGLQALDEDGTLITGLIAEYRRDANRFTAEVWAGVRELKPERVCRAAHSLKGASGTLGILKISALCLELERLAEARRFEEIASRLAPFETMVEQALHALDGVRRRGP